MITEICFINVKQIKSSLFVLHIKLWQLYFLCNFFLDWNFEKLQKKYCFALFSNQMCRFSKMRAKILKYAHL